VALPEESRVLKTPLAITAGGWGQIAEHGYGAMRRLVEAAIGPLPGRDIAGTCGRDAQCVCGCCWVRRSTQQALAETAISDRVVPRQ
jgi:hypothetical protein